MNRSVRHGVALVGAFCAAMVLDTRNEARAVGVFYADPGWAYAFDGDEAFYNDPDGPNPDYINGDDQNRPGGRNGTAALVDPGIVCDPSCHVDNAAAQWIHQGQQWDGSAPGDPLGGVADYPWNPTKPLLSPPVPGGVGEFMDGATSFIRIQDPGDGSPYGWADKDAQLGPGKPRHEGSNRRILFGHDIADDAAFSGDTAVIDNGITISFRARIATAATGPLDMIYHEDGPAPAPWPDDGLGYEVSNNGRGMFMVTQTRLDGGFNQLAFSLLNDNTVTMEALELNVGTKRGLAMNNRWNSLLSVNTNDATPETANVFEIDSDDLVAWQEFWITVEQLTDPVDGNTHEINVYHNGALTPQTFQTFLSIENEFDGSAFLGMGLSSDSRQGAFDVDFVAYKEGIHVPTLNLMGLPGDYNEDDAVDAADYVIWRKNEGTSNTLPNDLIGGMIGPAQYDQWRAHFGQTAGSGSMFKATVPEPPIALLVILGAAIGSWGGVRITSRSAINFYARDTR